MNIFFKDHLVSYEFTILVEKWEKTKEDNLALRSYILTNPKELGNFLDYDISKITITAVRRILGVFTTTVVGKSFALVPYNKLTMPIWKHYPTGRYLQFTSGFDRALIAKSGNYFN